MFDIVLALVLLIALIVGVARGFFASAGTIVGLIAGALAVMWLAPWAALLVPNSPWRGLILVAAAIAVLALITAMGAGIGAFFRRGIERTPLKGLDRLLGGVVSLGASALALLLLAGAVTTTGSPVLAGAVASSTVLRGIDALTPEPVDTALARIRSVVLADGLPRLGELLRPEVTPTAPVIALDDPALQQAAASVARVSGTAFSCNASMTGSGFVAAPGLVVTNAHVIAGVEIPVVELPGVLAREGRVVYFDPIDDLAVIAVEGLDAVPLTIVDPLPAGASAAVQGFPLGGPFTSVAAQVLSVGTVPVPDIHNESVAPREIYALAADVQPGNSGGPVLTTQGEVAGVVFGRGETEDTRGYAVTSTELREALSASNASADAVATGACTTR